MNHGELKTALAAYLHTSEFTDDQLDDFIRTAEHRIGRDCRLTENTISSTETPSSGVVTLPTRFVEAIRITRGSGSSIEVLRPVRDENEYWLGQTGDTGAAYYIQGDIYILPAADGDVDILYYEYPETLDGAADNATRPILDRYEGIYINGALAEASLYLRDWDSYQVFEERYHADVRRANMAARRRYRAETTGASSFISAPRWGN